MKKHNKDVGQIHHGRNHQGCDPGIYQRNDHKITAGHKGQTKNDVGNCLCFKQVIRKKVGRHRGFKFARQVLVMFYPNNKRQGFKGLPQYQRGDPAHQHKFAVDHGKTDGSRIVFKMKINNERNGQDRDLQQDKR